MAKKKVWMTLPAVKLDIRHSLQDADTDSACMLWKNNATSLSNKNKKDWFTKGNGYIWSNLFWGEPFWCWLQINQSCWRVKNDTRKSKPVIEVKFLEVCKWYKKEPWKDRTVLLCFSRSNIIPNLAFKILTLHSCITEKWITK